MDEKIKSIIKEIIANTGISVENIVFFGSRARGDADPDSDYD
ncbi:MAG TPA: nucleotidyltransferase domain-containing protein, partial [bacterium]|nr:nucleotidyltransferase domain-containing protein [bacterium]